MPSNPKRQSPMPTSVPSGHGHSTSSPAKSQPHVAVVSSINNLPGPSGEHIPELVGLRGDMASAEAGSFAGSLNAVNRRKQKRRQKQAARMAAAQHSNDPSVSADGADDYAGQIDDFLDGDIGDMDENTYDESGLGEGNLHAELHHHHQRMQASPGVLGQPTDSVHRKTKKKRNNKKTNNSKSTSHLALDESSTSHSTPSASLARHPSITGASSAVRSAHKVSRDRIWNTSTQEERENIKEFWLQLGEEERRSLVKVEKEAVLRKMKEQQKHSCSCTVCGRKRTAIEEELEVLYDAYYEELEHYANHNQGSYENGAAVAPSSRGIYQPPIRSLDRQSRSSKTRNLSRGRVHEIQDDEEDLEEEEEDYDEDEEDDEPYSDDEMEEAARATRAGFFAFGNSLTVKDGILTVADDLLKNDGKHFIDMMEQLAERRMAREEDSQFSTNSQAHQSIHNHPPLLDEEEYDDEEDDDYDSQEEDEYEDDEMDAMTEEQRMEEGRRMFQIFAARMFEQRVLTAYREKVARERQQKLIEELEEESRLDGEREAKKAREAQKKKDKKKQQKQAREEEKAKKEAEKAAQEAAARAAEEKKLEEQRRKKEEQRRKREAEKKAQEEERLQKEAEKQRRLQEERERQAEQERKQREQRERERKKREDSKRKERAEREAREKELREKKAKERERKAREEQTRKEKEAAAKVEREAKEQAKRDEQAAAVQQLTTTPFRRRGGDAPSVPSHFPPGLPHPHNSAVSAVGSPHIPVATPVVPKAPTPARPRQASQQGSHTSSPRSQPAGVEASHVAVSPGTTTGPSFSSGTSSTSSSRGPGPGQPPPLLHHPQPTAPMSPLSVAGRGSNTLGFHSIQNLNGVSHNAPLPGLGHHRAQPSHDMPYYSHQPGPGNLANQFRAFASQDSIPIPPGMAANRAGAASGRGLPLEPPSHMGQQYHGAPHNLAPISAQPPHTHRDTVKTHSRQPSTSHERHFFETQASQNLSMGRQPAPIQRPSSTQPQDAVRDDLKAVHADVDDLSKRLGSSALLDDNDVPLTGSTSHAIPTATAPPGLPGSGRMGFGTSPLYTESLNAAKHSNFPLSAVGSGTGWASQIPFGGSGFSGAGSWGTPAAWSNSAFGIVGGSHRLPTSRPVTIRLLVSQACKQLTAANTSKGNSSGYHNVKHVLQHVAQMNPPVDPPITLHELLDICDTEGNAQNGGGSFVIGSDGAQGTLVKFEPDDNTVPTTGPRGSIAPGDIGSPVPGTSVPVVGSLGTAASLRSFSSANDLPPPAGF